MKKYYNIIVLCIMLAGAAYAQDAPAKDGSVSKDAQDTQAESEGNSKDVQDTQAESEGASEDAQDTQAESEGISEDVQDTSAESEGVSEDAQDTPIEKKVFTDDDLNIINSIKVSSDYDLLLWLDSLGLPLQEDAEARRGSLLKYYGLPNDAIALKEKQSQPEQTEQPSTESPPPSDDESDPLVQVDTQDPEIAGGEATEIVIKHANSIDYFTFDQINENIFTLKGGVEIIINQEGRKRQHVISTDKLVYNESTRRGTALGDVSYSVYEYTGDSPPEAPPDDAIESFSSQIIVFEIDDFSADILVGSTQIDKDMKYGKKKDKKATLNFRIYSPRISRSEEDVITVSGASFTSSKSVPPIYRILLKRMWILAPEEWAISNATIFLGNIPVMWVPFFVNPGDQFFFHPSAGYNIRSGGFINTTTYFIGSIADSSGEDTFLDIFNFSKKSAEKKVIKGLFLRKVEAGDKIYTFPKGWLLKYILDYYTGLGLYSAVKGKFSKLWYFNKINFTGGIAFSQTVFKSNDNYFNNYITSKGKFERNWDHGYIYNKKIPFRYLFSLDVGLKIPKSDYVSYSTSLLFKQYSDSFINRDFSTRAESFSWQQILDANYDKTLLNKRKSQISSYYWRWNNSMTIHTDEWIGNYISAINLSDVRVQVNWNRKNTDKKLLPDAYAEQIPGSSVDEQIEGFFFYPSKAEIPSYKIKVKGTFLDIDSENLDFSNGIPKKEEDTENKKTESDTPAYTRPEYEIQSPFDTMFDRSTDDTKKSVSEESEESILLSEVEFPSVTTYDLKWAKIKYVLGYNISHLLDQTQYFNASKWLHPEDIPYLESSFIRYGQLTTDNQFTVTNKFTGLAEILTYQVDFILQLKHRLLNSDENLNEKDRASRKKSMDGYVREDFLNKHTVSLYPLKMFPLLTKSSIQYTSHFYIGKDVFSSVKEATWYEPDDKEWWKQHAFDQTLTTDFAAITQTLALKTILPPLDETITPSYKMSTDFMSLSTSIKAIKNKDTEEYEFDLWVSSTSFFFFEKKLKFTQSQTYDMFGDFWKKTSTSITAWWFTSTFLTIYDNYYKFDKSKFAFLKEGDRNLRPERLKVNVSYTSKDRRFWLDRISVKGNIKAKYTHDFLKFINNEFSLSYGFTFTISQFLVLSAKVAIKNDVMFIYFKEYSEELGLESPRDIWEDIANGFTFSDEEKLRETAFKLKSVTLGISQDFGGWILNFSYTGNPKRITRDNMEKYQWNNVVEISISWKPLPELNSSIFYRDTWKLEDEVK